MKARSIAVGAAAGLGSLAGLGWLGLRVIPVPFTPYPQPGTAGPSLAPSSDLPAPVTRFLSVVGQGGLPETTSAVLSGRGWLRLLGVTFPTRLRFIQLAGQGYRHDIVCTWFGLPIIKVNETYFDGHLRQELPVGVVENEPKADMAANLALWGEQAAWMPGILVADRRLRWEAIDDRSARLNVPSAATEDSLIFRFNPQTALIQSMEALRYRGKKTEMKIPWRIDLSDWRRFEGVLVPAFFAVTWLDEGTPWLTGSIEDIVYNVDVSDDIQASRR